MLMSVLVLFLLGEDFCINVKFDLSNDNVILDKTIRVMKHPDYNGRLKGLSLMFGTYADVPKSDHETN